MVFVSILTRQIIIVLQLSRIIGSGGQVLLIRYPFFLETVSFHVLVMDILNVTKSLLVTVLHKVTSYVAEPLLRYIYHLQNED
jgi:hypothetical protein